MAPHATDESHSHTNGNTSAPPNGPGGDDPDSRARRSRARRYANALSALEAGGISRAIREEEIRRRFEEAREVELRQRAERRRTEREEEFRREAERRRAEEEQEDQRRQIREELGRQIVRRQIEEARRGRGAERRGRGAERRGRGAERRGVERRGAEGRGAERLRAEREEEFRRRAEEIQDEEFRRRIEQIQEDQRRQIEEQLRRQEEEARRRRGGPLSRSRFRAERLGASEQRHREPPDSPEEYRPNSRHHEPPNGLEVHHPRPHSGREPGNRLSSTDRGAISRAMRQEQDRRARLRARYAALPAQALGSSRQRHHEPDAMGIDDPSWIEQRLQERMWREFPVPPEPNQRPRQNGINGINGNQRPRLNGINGINGNQRPRQNGINGINGVNGHSHEGEEASQDEHSDEDDKDASGQPMEQLNINGGHEDPDENDGHEQRDTGEAGHHRI